MDAGSPVGPDGYVNFQDDGSTDDDNICTLMTSDGSWIISPCDSTNGYVCETPVGETYSREFMTVTDTFLDLYIPDFPLSNTMVTHFVFVSFSFNVNCYK